MTNDKWQQKIQMYITSKKKDANSEYKQKLKTTKNKEKTI
jgi:hypothetical protein